MGQKERTKRVARKHAKIRELYDKRFTNQPRPRKYTKEYIIACLAEEFYLSMRQIENIIYTKPAAAPAAAVATDTPAAPEAALPLAA
jgi:hypothetical protein